MVVMFFIGGATYNDVVGNVASSFKSLKCVLKGILKYFTCGANSEWKSFVAKQTTMSDE